MQGGKAQESQGIIPRAVAKVSPGTPITPQCYVAGESDSQRLLMLIFPKSAFTCGRQLQEVWRCITDQADMIVVASG